MNGIRWVFTNAVHTAILMNEGTVTHSELERGIFALTISRQSIMKRWRHGIPLPIRAAYRANTPGAERAYRKLRSAILKAEQQGRALWWKQESQITIADLIRVLSQLGYDCNGLDLPPNFSIANSDQLNHHLKPLRLRVA